MRLYPKRGSFFKDRSNSYSNNHKIKILTLYYKYKNQWYKKFRVDSTKKKEEKYYE